MKNTNTRLDWISPLLSLVNEAGVSTEQLRSASGLKEMPFPESSMLSLLETAVQLTGDPTLGIRLGQHYDPIAFGTFGFALMSSADLREAIHLMGRYGKILGPSPAWKIFDHEEGLVLQSDLKQGTVAQRPLLAELVISHFCARVKFLINRPLVGVRLYLNYPAPSHACVYQKVFSMPVEFGADFSQLILPRQLLDKPVKTANPAGHVVFLQQCDEMLRDLNKMNDTSTAVRLLLMQSAGEFLNIKQVADRLHVTERTLRRRLKSETNSFRAICDEIKNVLPQKYLASTDLTVADIAHLLGYSETVNFRQAFVRWNGVTPSQCRSHALAIG
jgi:AraC-like DNA-binding protein